MNYKIACPSCQHVFSIKDPKPGKFKPKCSACSVPFALVVEEGEPLKIKIGKLASVPAKPIAQEAHAVSGIEVTMEQPSFPSTPGNSGSATEATMMHDDAHVPAVRVPEKPGHHDFSVNEATMDSEASQSSLASPPKSAHASTPISADGKNSSKSHSSIATGGLSRLGGYKILSELGAGGMGSVYLARQLSLDRPCALKTIQAHWAKNPRVIARFIREAYAAAQLTHHNVVQIYDLGQDAGTNFFSMELVSGGSLDDQLKAKGKLPPKLAATLILQASRGLKFAHDHGMVHRDIKPANLMMTSDGLVKVADMGLIKTPNAEDLPPEDPSDVQSMMLASARSQVTAVGSSMGTPAYMSPEQSMDATSVDKRADIYSLGCTFYALLTGKPPFDGSTMLEVISKHRVEKITRPERIITGLPTALGDIIEKMTEKKPEDRYQDLDETIHDLEVYLELREDASNAKIIHHPDNVDASEAVSNEERRIKQQERVQPEVPAELAGQLQIAAKLFNSSPVLLARRSLPNLWYATCGALTILAVLFSLWAGGAMLVAQASNAVQGLAGKVAEATPAASNTTAPTVSKVSALYRSMGSWFQSAIGFAIALFLAPIGAIAFAGSEGRSPLARRWRESFVNGGILEWSYWAVGGTVGLLAIHYLGLWIPVILASLVGIGVGAGFYFGIEKTLANQRKQSLEQAHGALRQLRLRGMEEEQVREITVQQSGRDWEEFFEALFGYEQMRTVRSRLQGQNRSDLKFHPSRRDKIIDRWDARLSEDRCARDEKILRKAGKAEMIANGVSESEAGKRADALAASIVDAATETRQAMQDIAVGKLTVHAAEAKRQRIKQMMAEARSGKFSKREVRSRSLDRFLGQLLGSKFRFVCSALLFLGVGMWLKANQHEMQGYWQQARSTIDTLKNTKLDANAIENAKNALTASNDKAAAPNTKNWQRIWLGMISEKNVLFVAIAAVLMLFGTMLYGWKKSLLLVPLALALCFVPLLL